MLIVALQGVSDYQHEFNKANERSVGIRNWPLYGSLFRRLYNEMPLVHRIVTDWTAHLPLNIVLDAQFLLGEGGIFDGRKKDANGEWIEYSGIENHDQSWPYQFLLVPAELYDKTYAYVYHGRFFGRDMKTWWDMPEEILRFVFVTEDETRALTESDYFAAVISALKKVNQEST